MIKTDPVIIRGTVMGRCPICGKPFMGEMDADETDIKMQCVSCCYKKTYCYRWPDELPRVTIRPKRAKKGGET